MAVAWFSNSGSFQFTRVAPEDSNTYDPETDTSGSFVGVYRDNRGGVTVVVATHDLPLMRQAKTQVSARVLKLSGGKIMAAGADL